VAEQTFNADPGVLFFKVSKCELIKDSAIGEACSSNFNLAIQAKTDVPTEPGINV
jgi:hypothetical protein